MEDLANEDFIKIRVIFFKIGSHVPYTGLKATV